MHGQIVVPHSIMIHARVSEEYIHFSLMHTTDNISPILSIKHLVNQYDEVNTPHKLETGTKPSVSNLRVLSCPCVLRKSYAHVDTKTLNMRHQSKTFFGVCLLEFSNIKNGSSSMYLLHRN